jgi:signal transduction histidine kinase
MKTPALVFLRMLASAPTNVMAQERLARSAVALVLLASASTPPTVWAQERAHRTVLAIHWGSADFPPTPLVNASIQSALRSDPDIQVDYFTEYLESDAFAAEAASQALTDYIRQKYRGRRIDVVIAIADPALRFVLDHRDELFPGVPIVYSGVAVLADNRGGAPRGLTAVLRGVAYVETLKLALAQHPSTQQVFVVGGSSDRQVADSVKAELRDFSQRIRLTFLDDTTVPRLIDAVKAIPPRSLILYIFFPDARPAGYEADEIVRLVASAARVPVYGTNERYVGTGVVGGVLRGTSETGVRVGELARRILHGARADDLPIENARLVPTFDWRQLRRWDLEESRLPPGSDIRFRTLTAWESYKAYIIGTIVVVAAQLVLIGGLLAQRARRRRAEETVKAREATLRISYERSRLLTGKLINAEEATRAGIARDLHDGVCQDLIGVSMAVAGVKRSSGQIQDVQTQRTLSMLLEQTRGVCETLRWLSHDLHPAMLQLLGLAAALKMHCTEVEQRQDVQVQVAADGYFGDIRPDVALCLFRIAQESLRNAVNHGDAKRLTVSLTRSGDHIELVVADDGSGFDVEAVRRASSGLGLVSMEERAHAVGADVQIVSGVRQGTTICVRGPAA